MLWAPVIFFLGLLVIQAQVLLFRELIVLMKGNELAIGGILSVWLGSTGLGSFWGGKRARRSPGAEINWFLIGMAFSLPLSLVTLRTVPVLLGYGLGEPLPVWLSLLVILMALGPFCLLSGGPLPPVEPADLPAFPWVLVDPAGLCLGGLGGGRRRGAGDSTDYPVERFDPGLVDRRRADGSFFRIGFRGENVLESPGGKPAAVAGLRGWYSGGRR